MVFISASAFISRSIYVYTMTLGKLPGFINLHTVHKVGLLLNRVVADLFHCLPHAEGILIVAFFLYLKIRVQ